MKLNSSLIKASFAALILAALTGCGGGGGGSSSSSGDDNTDTTPDPTPEPASATFTVSLTNVEIQRLSSGEAVEVDTAKVESGELEYTP